MTKEEALNFVEGCLTDYLPIDDETLDEVMKALRQEPKTGHCKWIKYDHRTICPKYHDIDNPYWRIPQSMEKVMKYCPYCGKEIEVE